MIDKVITGNQPLAAISPDLRIAFIFDEQMRIAFVNDVEDNELLMQDAGFKALCLTVAQVLSTFVLPNYSTLYASNIFN